MDRLEKLPSTSGFKHFAIAAVALIAATILLGTSGTQFDRLGALPTIVHDAYAGDHAGRIAIGAPPAVRGAAADTRGTSALLVATLPDRGEDMRWLKLSARVDSQIIDLGDDKTRPPIVANWFTRENGARQNVALWPVPVGPVENIGWSTVRSWPVNAESVVAAVMPRKSEGATLFRGFRVEILALSTLYIALVTTLALGWAALMLIAINHARTHINGPEALLPLALATFIAAAVMFSGDFIENVIRPIVSLAHGTRAGVSLVPTFKVGHGVAFALLTCSLLAFRQRLVLTVPQCLLLVAMVGIASEAAQLHLPARTAQFSDLAIDAVGMLAGIALWRLTSHFIEHSSLRRWSGKAEPDGLARQGDG